LKTNEDKYQRLVDEAQRTRDFTHQLIEGSVDGILAFDRDYRYVLWNPAMQRMMGLERGQVVGRVAFELFPFLQESGADELYRRTLQGETMVARDRPYDIPDTGRQGFYDAHHSPIIDETGAIIGGLAIIREVTERKLAEDALRESRWLFQSSLDALATYIAILDENGAIVAVNAAWRRFAEIDAAPWSVRGKLGEDYLALCEQAQRDGIVEAAAVAEGIRAVAGNQQVGFYLEYVCQSLHEEQWFIVRVTRFGRDGGPVRLVIAHDNVTALREAEAAQRKSEARFRTIYEEAGMGIMVMDLAGHILQGNPALETKLGYSQEALRQRPFRDLIHADDQERHDQLYQALLVGDNPRYRGAYRCRKVDGGLLWVQVTMSLLRDETGEPYRALAMVQDISAQKQIEAELAEVQHRLSGSREKERLHIAQEIHDGPVQELIGADLQLKLLSGRLEHEAHGAAVQEKIGVVREVVQQVNRKLREICGELRPPTLAPFGLEVAIRSHLEQFQLRHAALTVQHQLVRDGQLLPEPTRLALFRIYQEMLNNVVKHAQATHVLVKFTLDVEQIVLEIQDNGVGFQVPQRWIQLARRGHLGLVGMSERAEEIGGRLIILSTPGRGTIIRVVAPSPLAAVYSNRGESASDTGSALSATAVF
jgi:PAS domain S-box-containing protein